MSAWLALLAVLGAALIGASVPAPDPAGAQSQVVASWVRTVGVNDLVGPGGRVDRPRGITYDTTRGWLLVIGRRGADNAVLRVGFDEDLHGEYAIDGLIEPEHVTFDPTADVVTALRGTQQVDLSGPDQGQSRPPTRRRPIGDLGLRGPRSVTMDPRTGELIVLESDGQLARVARDAGTPPRRTSVQGAGDVRAIAFNGVDGRVYALDATRELLHALEPGGAVQVTYDLREAMLTEPRAMVFAPTSDATDPPGDLNLFIVDEGSGPILGSIAEVSLDVSTSATSSLTTAAVDTATLTRTVRTSDWSPASPDPAGVEWVPSSDELIVVDSEVDEQTGAGWHDVNVWRSSRTGSVVGTGTLWGPKAATFNGATGYSKEPTGVGYQASSDVLFVSDDSARGVFVIERGPDGVFATSDDVVVSFIDANALGSTDTEDPSIDPTTGHLFFLDGVGMEVLRIDPVDGMFGNGNDVASHFDISHLGPKDYEGLAVDPERGTLYVGARSKHVIFEITNTGALVRSIDVTGISGLTFISGLAIAPASDGSGVSRLWISDRAADNGYLPSENDGRLFEIAVSGIGGGSTSPTTTTTAPATTTTTTTATTTTTTTTTTVSTTTTTTAPTTTTTTAPSTTTTTLGTPAGAPTLRAASSGSLTSASRTSLTIARPAGVQPGDVLVAHVRHRGSALAADGWTPLGTIAQDNATHTVVYKVAGASEPESYVFDQGVNQGRMAGGIVAYSGVDTRAPIHAWAASPAGTPVLQAPSAHATVANTVVLRLWGWRGASASEPGVGFNRPPAEVTERWSAQVGHANDDRNRVLGGDQFPTSTGPVGTSTASGSTSADENRRSAFTVILAPAP